MATYRTVKIGDESTTDFRVFFERVDASGEATIVSPFHDIPLHAGEGVFNMVVEIPRGTNAKLEIATGEKMNPIKQDVKKGALRFVGDVAPYSGYIWNYGAFPQTWEDPTYLHPETNAYGDKDPLDVCEIGSAPGHTGQVKQVKVLGIIAMIDEGETDWKVLVVDVTDPLAAQLNDLDDVQRLLPGITQATYEWLRTYKMSSGAAPNTFGYDGAAKNKAFALHIIQENHEFWKQVSSGKKPAKGEKYDLALANTTLAATETPYKVAAADARSAVKDLPHKAREAAAAAAPAAAAAATGEDVVVLTKSTFKRVLEGGAWLVKFYAPWCGHCKRLAPTWDELATKSKGSFHVAKVDCTVEGDICSKFDIQGYPTVKLIKDGKQYEFNGARTIEGFTGFVQTGYTSATGTALPNKDEL